VYVVLLVGMWKHVQRNIPLIIDGDPESQRQCGNFFTDTLNIQNFTPWTAGRHHWTNKSVSQSVSQPTGQAIGDLALGSSAGSQLALGRLDHVAVDLLQVGQVLQYLDAAHLLGHLVVHGVAHEQYIAQIRQTGKLVQLCPRFYLVVRNVQHLQIGAAGEPIKRSDLVVGDPQLFKCARNLLELLDLNTKNSRKQHVMSNSNH
jgi:hypothetical protein